MEIIALEGFWARTAPNKTTGCWEWQGAITSSGYGNMTVHGVAVQAHRVAYYIARGGIDLTTDFRSPGIASSYCGFVLHKCDNRICCNPEHLFLGSMSDNQLDAYAKGRRSQPSSKHVNAKLTADQVRQIRTRYGAKQDKQVTLAKEFAVSQRVISLVVSKKAYKDVE